MKKTLLFLLLAMIVFIALLSIFSFQEVKLFRARADVSQATFSIENSYVFVTPLRARAGGQEKIRVTVFVLNNQGIGVSTKQVQVSGSSLNIETAQGITDAYGKAMFDVSSQNKGDFEAEVTIEGRVMNQKARVTFY